MSASARRFSLAALVFFFLLSTSVAQAVQYRAAGDGARQYGIAAYTLEQKGQQLEARLLALDKKAVGDITIQVTENQGRILTLVRGNKSLVLRWTPATGELFVTDWNGDEGSVRVQDGVANSSASTILRRSDRDFRLLTSFLTELRNEIEAIDREIGPGPEIELPIELQREIASLATTADRRSKPALSNREIQAVFQPMVECTGSRNRGDSVSGTRSGCCENANDEVQGECWNSKCAGCCETLSCDAVCALGDYFCSCGVTGYECGAQ